MPGSDVILSEKAGSGNQWQRVRSNCFGLLKRYITPCRGMSGKGCSLWDTPIFCVAEDRFMAGESILPKSGQNRNCCDLQIGR